jgi:hypothetical protein
MFVATAVASIGLTSVTTSESQQSIPITIIRLEPAGADLGKVGSETWAVWLGLVVVLIVYGLWIWFHRGELGQNSKPDAREDGSLSVNSQAADAKPGFEAVEYRHGGPLRGVRAASLSTNSTLEEAVEVAREARRRFQPHGSDADAWWVVWNRTSQRAAWIAEAGTPGESVIDLRTGQREPYLAGDDRPAR